MSVLRRRDNISVQMLRLDGGESTASRADWRAAVLQRCGLKYDDSKNTVEDQKRRLAYAISASQARLLDGLLPPRLSLATVFSTRASMRSGAAASEEYLAPEMWKRLPVLMVIVTWSLFWSRIIHGMTSLNDHWRSMVLNGIPKLLRPDTVEYFRFVATSPTLQKWYLKCVMALAKDTVRSTSVNLYGFRKCCSSGLVTELYARRCTNRSHGALVATFCRRISPPLSKTLTTR